MYGFNPYKAQLKESTPWISAIFLNKLNHRRRPAFDSLYFFTYRSVLFFYLPWDKKQFSHSILVLDIEIIPEMATTEASVSRRWRTTHILLQFLLPHCGNNEGCVFCISHWWQPVETWRCQVFFANMDLCSFFWRVPMCKKYTKRGVWSTIWAFVNGIGCPSACARQRRPFRDSSCNWIML